jgi:signal transduction histidine kinase
MATTDQSLRGKVSRRIFLLFIICALVPISVHSLFSFFQVRQQLVDQSRRMLAEQSKQFGNSVMERLLLLNDDMSLFAGRLRALPPDSLGETLSGIAGTGRSRFTALAFIPGPSPPVTLPEGADAHLRDGKAVLTCRPQGAATAIQFLLALDENNPRGGLLQGQVNPSFLWRPALARPAEVEITVLDGRGLTLFTSDAGPVPFDRRTINGFTVTHAGHFSYRGGGRDYLACHRSIYLQPQFLSPSWVMVIGEPMASVLAPAADFQRFFPLILLLTLATIVALSLIRIRQTLTPVRRLQEATMRIADGELGHQVEIHSRDEFEALGESFNRMSLQLKDNEALLLQAERLSTIGRMSAGMVHEMKQPMTVISGYLELAMQGSLPEMTVEHLEKVNGAVRWLFSLVEKYRMFSRRPDSVLEKISLAAVAAQVHELFGHQFQVRRVTCRLENEQGQPAIMGNGSELQQVLINLLSNAMDSIDAREDGGRLIEMRTFVSNGRVSFRISDTGCGISRADRERIFEPFYTTKGAEKGTGLGMAVVHTILSRHEANIEVDSEPGKGTAITLTFPAPTAPANCPPA